MTFLTIRSKIAGWLSPEREARLNTDRARFQDQVRNFDYEVSSRVAEIILKMDPFEPLMKKYNVIFSEEWEKPEENLDAPSQIRLFMWAYGIETDPSFRHLTDWIRNTQGNATLQKATHNDEWFYGRAAVATISLLVREVGRLASRYRDIKERKDDGFNEHLAVE